MSRQVVKFVGIFSFLLCCISGLAQQEFKIQKGDKLNITVMEHPEFEVIDVMVLPDGSVQFPAIGFIKAAGLTPSELSKNIQVALKTYVVDPIVTVYIRTIQNQQVNVLGYLNRPGQYQIFQPVSVLTGLSRAGGIKNARRVKYLKVIRANGETDQVKMKSFLRDPNLLGDLNAGDTLFVQEKNEFNWARLTFFTSILGSVIAITQ
ncbi:polysaccharide export protein [Puteibacter caeruleilacunae]|nr:polysaccharide export protein [Puteibacter caeruleilacunae]